MKNNLLALILGTVIGIILIGSLLAPVIANAGNENDETYSNNVANHILLKRDDTGSHTFSWTAGETTYTFDGTSYPVQNDCVITTDKASFVAAYSSGTYSFLCYYTPSDRIVSTSYDISITMANGTISGTIGTTSVNQNYSWAYVPDPNGDHFSTYGTVGTYYISSVNDIVANIGYSMIMNGEATYKGNEATLLTDLTPVGHVYSVSNNGGVKTVYEDTEHTVNGPILPISVTYHDPYLDDEKPLLEIIPILLIVAIIAGVAVVIVRHEVD